MINIKPEQTMFNSCINFENMCQNGKMTCEVFDKDTER